MIYIDSTQCPSVRFSRMLPLSYKRQHIIVITPLTQLMKTHVIALLARPTFINSSATHNLSGWPFSSKNQRRLLPCFLYKSFFCGCDNTPIWHIHYWLLYICTLYISTKSDVNYFRDRVPFTIWLDRNIGDIPKFQWGILPNFNKTLEKQTLFARNRWWSYIT